MILGRFISLIIFACSALCAVAHNSADTLTVYFRQGKADIDPWYMGNAAVMERIRSMISESSSPDSLSASVCGSASPEGSVAVNTQLAAMRAKAAADFFGIPYEGVTPLPDGRDWSALLDRIHADKDVPFRDEVLQVVADISDCGGCPTSVAMLENMRDGEPYLYLYRLHFPYLRNARITFNHPATDTAGDDALTVTEATHDTKNDFLTTATVYQTDDATVTAYDARLTEAGKGYVFGVKTNLLYDAALIPNIGVEFPVGRHFSIGADWMYAWWKSRRRNRHWRIYGGDVNARYWFGNARSLTGHHLGVYGTVLLYQVAFGGRGYISGVPGQNMTGGKPWLGGGIDYGFSLNVSRRLNIDFSLGIGYATGEQREYRMKDDCYVLQSSTRKHWFGPTKAEISLVWKIGRLAQQGKEVAE